MTLALAVGDDQRRIGRDMKIFDAIAFYNATLTLHAREQKACHAATRAARIISIPCCQLSAKPL